MQRDRVPDSLVLITAPSSAQLTSDCSGDCDCACPAVLPADASRPSLPPSTRVQLHASARFLALDDQYMLLYIPSVLAGVVVNRALQAWLLRLRRPTSLRQARRSTAERGLIERCISLGILVADRPLQRSTRSDTLVAWLHVTNACNLRCTYCYLHKTDEPMSAATGYAAIDAIIRSAVRHGYSAIKLKYAGGEAALNFALIEDLHVYAGHQAAAHGLRLGEVVLSNGVGLARAQLERLHELGIRLMISLDGMAEDHDRQRVFANGRGSFRAVAHTIERARALGLVPDISVTISGQTAGGAAELVAWLLERDLPFSINFYRENDCSAGFAELQLDQQRIIAGMLAAYRAIEACLPRRSLLGALTDRASLNGPHERPCGAGHDYLVIDQRGGVAKCQMEIERPITSVAAADPLGLVREDTIGVRNLAVHEKQGCHDCEWQLWCAGGCPVATFRATGRYDLRSPHCAIYQALYPEVVRLEGLRLLRYGQREQFAIGAAEGTPVTG